MRRLAADPIARISTGVWLAVAAFYVVPHVPPDVLRRLGETYSTLPIWPWAIAGALVDLSAVTDARERAVWRWQAFSFAILLFAEGVRAAFVTTGAIDILSEWFYMTFYLGQLASALHASRAAGSRLSAFGRAAAASMAAAVALDVAAIRFPAAYATGLPSSAIYLTFDAALVTLWWRARAGQPARLAGAFAGLAVAAALFLVTDMGGMISMAGWYRLAPGQPWDLFWTLPALVYVLSVRAGRAGA